MNSLSYMQQLKKTLESVDLAKIDNLADMLFNALKNKKTVYVFGNGDSANNALHFAADLSKTSTMHGYRFRFSALNANIPLMTAWANDESYDSIFKRQLESVLEKGDVVIGISTSGNSPNVLNAMEYARKQGAVTVGIAAFEGGKMKPFCDHLIIAKTDNVEIAEDIHWIIGHLIKINFAGKMTASEHEM